MQRSSHCDLLQGQHGNSRLCWPSCPVDLRTHIVLYGACFVLLVSPISLILSLYLVGYVVLQYYARLGDAVCYYAKEPVK